MGTLENAVASQLAHIEKRTGQSLGKLVRIARASGFSRHGEIRNHVKATLGIGFGDANALAHDAAKFAEPGAETVTNSDGIAAALSVGPKVASRSIHYAMMAKINAIGKFEIAPKKTCVSVRRKKAGRHARPGHQPPR
jgi:hypothetical protein